MYVLVLPLPGKYAVLQQPLCATAHAVQISIPPCSPLPLPHSPRAFLTHLRLALFLVPAHSVEGEIMTWISWLHYRKEKQFLFCCSVTKGKTARDITLLPLPQGETFVSDWQWGADTKSPCCCWRVRAGCTAWISKLRGWYIALLSSSFRLSPPLVSK